VATIDARMLSRTMQQAAAADFERGDHRSESDDRGDCDGDRIEREIRGAGAEGFEERRRRSRKESGRVDGIEWEYG
jgi:hypothetical protein